MMSRLQRPERAERRELLGLPLALLRGVAWLLALIGYFGPWIGRRAAALAWNAYDLFDLLRLLPQIESGAVRVNLYTLRFPLVGLAVLLPLLLAQAPNLWRWTVAALGAGIAIATLPPYPEIVSAWRTPGWRIVFWGGVGAMIAVGVITWLGPRLARIRPWLIVGWLALTALPALPTLHRLQPALSHLHARPIAWGWGYWCWLIGIGLIALLTLSRIPAKVGHHPG
ncbi:MAG: hypothetical protein GVY30_13120 [Chloroflexi bacterium]|jgi:hypothetical protein|nr:hypothetical protein [Chloroflexota bacterium]